MMEFQRQFYQTVGRLYAEHDELDFQIATAQVQRRPDDAVARAAAEEARDQARESAQEAGLIHAQLPPWRSRLNSSRPTGRPPGGCLPLQAILRKPLSAVELVDLIDRVLP
jgi:hypothetical protein